MARVLANNRYLGFEAGGGDLKVDMLPLSHACSKLKSVAEGDGLLVGV